MAFKIAPRERSRQPRRASRHGMVTEACDIRHRLPVRRALGPSLLRWHTRPFGGLVVSYSVLAAVAVLAFVLGVFTARRRSSSNTKVIWESTPQPSVAHEAAIADPELRTFLEQKQLISAIKRYRELTGSGLKESKDAVEALQRTLPG
jgi:ribosomal protein L7/L12